MKKILISGPVLSRSGYGEMARFALRALRVSDADLYITTANWGNTGWLSEDNEERRYINSLIMKTQLYSQNSGNAPKYDVSVQITIPNEWKRLAAVNIGYTAGIESNMISPAWLEPSNQMDKIIVISEHAKASFVNTVFGNDKGQRFQVSAPIEVVHLPFRKAEKIQLDLKFKHDFNFLAVCQWGVRKNLDQAIVGFLEEFRNEPVGLVLKINTVNDSIVDRGMTEKRLKDLLANFPNRKCSVTLIHGHMKEKELEALYNHPQIKAMVSTTHGEGFGLPLVEAAANGLPIIATDWSGHTDFLYMPDGASKKRMFGKVDFELKPVAKEHVWVGVLEEGTSWAYPLMNSYREKLREVFKDHGRFKSQAAKLAVWVQENFNEDKLQASFSNLIPKEFKVEEWLKSMDLKNIKEHE